mmetsp:Transcript_8490/g.20050  ORF Transcript_8490/g.20050 Transcript_8490/m.20050 type:complete len:211 (+) Transcript_8490:496-1128(+)
MSRVAAERGSAEMKGIALDSGRHPRTLREELSYHRAHVLFGSALQQRETRKYILGECPDIAFIKAFQSPIGEQRLLPLLGSSCRIVLVGVAPTPPSKEDAGTTARHGLYECAHGAAAHCWSCCCSIVFGSFLWFARQHQRHRVGIQQRRHRRQPRHLERPRQIPRLGLKCASGCRAGNGIADRGVDTTASGDEIKRSNYGGAARRFCLDR